MGKRRIKVKKRFYCIFCKQEFFTKNYKQRYCSRRCGSAFRLAKHLAAFPHGKGRISPSSRKKARDLMGNKCTRCSWSVEPGVLEIHHKDRNAKNNTPENLELLCPNCHGLDHWQDKTGQFRGYRKSSSAS